MGVYVFNTEALLERLQEDALLPSKHDFGYNIIPSMVGRDRLYANRFEGYWRRRRHHPGLLGGQHGHRCRGARAQPLRQRLAGPPPSTTASRP